MLSLLFEKRFDGYFAAMQEGVPTWLFVHVPKTAGSSFRAELARVLQPDANIFADYGDAARPHAERLDLAVARFLERSRQTQYRFASGHLFPRHVDAIRHAIGPLRCITMLRHPVKRVVSDYRYQCSPMHPGHEAFKERFPSIEDYLQNRGEHNKAARYLVPQELLARKDEAEIIGHIMGTYQFVGLQEMYPLAFRTIFALIGERRSPSVRERVNADGADQPLAPEVVARITQANALDLVIFKAFADRWRAIRDDLRRYLTTKGWP